MIPRPVALRLYRWALRAFPKRHRHTYAAEMVDAFDHELTSRQATNSGWRLVSFVAAACLNAIGAGIGERRRDRRWRVGDLFSTLDFMLAWRMLLRYPGLSIVSVLGMSVGIAIATFAFAMVSAMTNSTVPLEEGDRVVSLVMWDTSISNRESRLVHDFTAWRSMTAVNDMSITRTVQRNLIVPGKALEAVTVAEISAAAFRVARVPAFRGRVLLAEDEAPGAPEVMVIGYDEWVRRFDADPEIVGRRRSWARSRTPLSE